MTAQPWFLPQAQFACRDKSGAFCGQELACPFCGIDICTVEAHQLNPDVLTLCHREDYWHGQPAHLDCHSVCTAPECDATDEEVLEAWLGRNRNL